MRDDFNSSATSHSRIIGSRPQSLSWPICTLLTLRALQLYGNKLIVFRFVPRLSCCIQSLQCSAHQSGSTKYLRQLVAGAVNTSQAGLPPSLCSSIFDRLYYTQFWLRKASRSLGTCYFDHIQTRFYVTGSFVPPQDTLSLCTCVYLLPL